MNGMPPTAPPSDSRRGFLRIAGFASMASAAAACAPTAAPAPAAQGGASAAPAAKAAWEAEWEKLVAAAKQEGGLKVLTTAGGGYRKALDVFEKTFPGIAVEHEAFSSASLVMPKIRQERTAGVYSYDAAVFSVRSFLQNLRPEGVVDPVRDLIIRPDVMDDKAWSEGYERGYVDSGKKVVYVARWSLGNAFWINTDVIKEGELKSVKDLLDPKWKGKMIFSDVRSGNIVPPMFAIKTNLGEDVVRKLIVDQQPSFRRDDRQVAEGMVRGQFPIGMGVRGAVLVEFTDQGLGKNLKPIDLPEARVVLSSSGVWAFNKASHPNAAKLFINWVLTKEGQLAWNLTETDNSRRLDVPPIDPATTPTPEKKAVYAASEEMLDRLDEIRQAMEKMVAG